MIQDLKQYLGLTCDILPIMDVPKHYISADGHVISAVRRIPIIKATTKTNDFHRVIELKHTSGEKEWHYVHHLVMEQFGPPRPSPEAMVLHKDDDKTNNAISNLYWGDKRQNGADARRNSRANRNALTDEDVKKIRFVKGMISYNRLGHAFKVTPRYVSMVAKGQMRSNVEDLRIPDDDVLVVRIV